MARESIVKHIADLSLVDFVRGYTFILDKLFNLRGQWAACYRSIKTLTISRIFRALSLTNGFARTGIFSDAVTAF